MVRAPNAAGVEPALGAVRARVPDDSVNEPSSRLGLVRLGSSCGHLRSKSHSKAELLELAASMDIEGCTKMSKAELISAISEAAPAAR